MPSRQEAADVGEADDVEVVDVDVDVNVDVDVESVHEAGAAAEDVRVDVVVGPALAAPGSRPWG